MLNAMENLSNVISRCVKWIIECAPFGIMGLVFSTVNENGMAVFGDYGKLLLLIPMACSLFGIGNDIAMQVVAVGFIIGVIQDSVETALNSSSDAFFIIATDMKEKMK